MCTYQYAKADVCFVFLFIKIRLIGYGAKKDQSVAIVPAYCLRLSSFSSQLTSCRSAGATLPLKLDDSVSARSASSLVHRGLIFLERLVSQLPACQSLPWCRCSVPVTCPRRAGHTVRAVYLYA